jgi:hypothetical protein
MLGGCVGGRIVCAHDFAGKVLRAHRSFAQRVELLPLPIELFQHFALVLGGLLEQPRERRSLVRAFPGEPLV